MNCTVLKAWIDRLVELAIRLCNVLPRLLKVPVSIWAKVQQLSFLQDKIEECEDTLCALEHHHARGPMTSPYIVYMLDMLTRWKQVELM